MLDTSVSYIPYANPQQNILVVLYTYVWDLTIDHNIQGYHHRVRVLVFQGVFSKLSPKYYDSSELGSLEIKA